MLFVSVGATLPAPDTEPQHCDCASLSGSAATFSALSAAAGGTATCDNSELTWDLVSSEIVDGEQVDMWDVHFHYGGWCAVDRYRCITFWDGPWPHIYCDFDHPLQFQEFWSH